MADPDGLHGWTTRACRTSPTERKTELLNSVRAAAIPPTAARIGHTDLAMLERHYAMVVGSAEREAADKIQVAFDNLTNNVVPIRDAK